MTGIFYIPFLSTYSCGIFLRYY